MNTPRATILTIGDELLIGQVLDTNSQWIAKKLTETGVSIELMQTISDKKTAILSFLESCKSELIIVTGGLGPTKDDITKHVLADFFGVKMVVHKETLERLTSYYEKRNRELNELNKTQAFVPENCEVLKNEYGTAPGMWFENKEQIIVSLPGVPLEMKKLIEFEVLPKVKQHFSTPFIYHQTFHTIGISEADLSIKLVDWEDNLPSEVSLAYLPELGMTRLRLSGQFEHEKTG